MMGRSPQCYIPSFVEIGPLVPEKKIFEGYFTIYGRGGHLDHIWFHIKFGVDWASGVGEEDV